jgi:hypothetical protein
MHRTTTSRRQSRPHPSIQDLLSNDIRVTLTPEELIEPEKTIAQLRVDLVVFDPCASGRVSMHTITN